MKIDCPICGKMGFVQVRGKNVMIQHYQGFEGGKRIYQYHKVPYAQFQELQVIADASKKSASKKMQVKESSLSREAAFKWTGRDLNPRLPRCERGDHTELIYRPIMFL